MPLVLVLVHYLCVCTSLGVTGWKMSGKQGHCGLLVSL